MHKSLTRIITPVLLFLASTFVMASEPETTLVLKLKDGKTEYFFLADKPVIRFQETALNIQSSDFSAELDNVLSFSFEEIDREAHEQAVSVKSPKTENRITVVYNDGKNVKLLGDASSDKIHIYSADGRIVKSRIDIIEGGVNINLDAQPAGIYIIRTNNQSFKISKK